MLYVDAMREFWSEWVINYDHSHQSILAQATVNHTRELYEESGRWLKMKYRAVLERLRHTQRVASRDPIKIGVIGLFLLALIVFALKAKRILRYVRDIRVSRHPAASPAHAASIWYERMIRLLNRRGMARLPAQTPEEFLQTIDENDIKTSVANFSEHYERA